MATIAGAVRLPAGTHASIVRYQDLARPSSAAQIPEGFVLPASDAGVRVSSFVTADLDADGDLDIVAAELSADGLVGIVVWVNDGTGRLTREAAETRSSDSRHRARAALAVVSPPRRRVERFDSTARPRSAGDAPPPRLAMLPSSRCLAVDNDLLPL